MAYARRTTARRRAAPRSRTRAAPARRRAPARRARTSARGGAQTIRIVVEQMPASGVSRSLNPAQAAGALPRKAKF